MRNKNAFATKVIPRTFFSAFSLFLLFLLSFHCISHAQQRPDGLDSLWTSQESTAQPEVEYKRIPLFALKNNLLYDLALTPNIEVEIPLSGRWSVNAEFQGGWWLRENDSFCWQIMAGGMEGRYRLGNRYKRSALSGWFVGAFVGAGYYDFQLKSVNGVQGEFYIMSGLSGGYTLPLSNRWLMEFSAGIGYFSSDYRRYRIEDRLLMKQGESMRMTALMPLKAKVSLSWLICGRKKVKGGERP
ncbi:MAG: DUF3575 domain-containing protein [Tannerellaceae bacterium]|jgi:hypothetical protein|nr:DUF3575 domain-containing protein [Tannerellaceae bacterium]